MSRPPRLPDQAIRSLIEELRAQHAGLTGTRLRDELARRHGARGGVTRIYRLLKDANAAQPTTYAAPPSPARTTGDQLPADVADLQQALRYAQERAALAEHREEHHQARWAAEIHALREQVRTMRGAAHRLPQLERELQDRSRELAAAYHRIADLEAQLR